MVVVIPAFNEAAVLPGVLAELAGFVPLTQVIVVDDASTDDTSGVAQQAGARVFRHAINRGQGAALATGLAAAVSMGAAVVVTFDADGQHDPSDLPALIAPVLAGHAQVVLGTRFGTQQALAMPRSRRLILRAAVWFTRLTEQVRITDVHNGYRAFSAHAARQIHLRQDRMEHASEILQEIRRHRLTYVECPVRVRYTAYSLAKGQKNRAAVGMGLRLLLHKVIG